jgi:tRNA(Glu) U13 pseudouridine synthase TruD
MRIRQHIEDFVVDEVASAEFGERGDFLIGRLEKSGLGTLEALRELARELGVSMKRISFGGLKRGPKEGDGRLCCFTHGSPQQTR